MEITTSSAQAAENRPAPGAREASRPSKLLLIAVSALFVQQTFAVLSRLILPVLAPAISEELGLNPALVGAYTGLLSSVAMVLALGAGGFIERFGAWRLCQFTLVAAAAAMVVATPGALVLFALSAVLISLSPGVSTAASSHILARHCPPRLAPLFFSIKQTGVPAGGFLAGMLVPLLALEFGWRGTLVAAGMVYLVLALLLQPFRARFDGTTHAGHRSFLADARASVTAATANPLLRRLILAAFAFTGLQVLFDSFFVTFLVSGLGYSLPTAGLVFSAGQGVAVFTRVLWGGIAGLASPRVVLAGLGLAMALASAAMGLASADWPLAALTTLAMVYTATAFSWHGVLLAEVARLAPAGQVGAATGGVVGFIMASATLYPLAFAAILAATGSYGTGYALAALPALAVGVLFLSRRR